MLTVEYHRDGETVEDHWAEEFVWVKVKEHNDYGDISVVVANEIVIEAFRALIAEGKIDYKEIRFLFDGEYLSVNEEGTPKRWPVGFCTVSNGFLQRILGWNKKAQS